MEQTVIKQTAIWVEIIRGLFYFLAAAVPAWLIYKRVKK
jgi:hypothetical protein